MDKHIALSTLELLHFRGINSLKIENLSQINVFAGANNSGKTSILEAIRILRNPSDIGTLVSLSAIRASVGREARKQNIVQYLLSIFQKEYDIDELTSSNRIQIGATIQGKQYLYEAIGTTGEFTDTSGQTNTLLETTIKMSTGKGKKSNYQTETIKNGEERTFIPKENDLFHAIYVFSNVNYYRSTVRSLTRYIMECGKDELLVILKSFDPIVQDISIIQDEIYLHSQEYGVIPLFSYGAGMQKAVCLAVEIAFCKNGVILVDEVDNAIHVSAFEDVFRWFIDACIKYHVQAFITTHSAEALDAILRVDHELHNGKDLLRIITLRKNLKLHSTWGKIRTGEEAYIDREKFELELRV